MIPFLLAMPTVPCFQDSLEEALVATHQEVELYHNQPLAMEKLRFKKETLQNQLINIRGELSQASSVRDYITYSGQRYININGYIHTALEKIKRQLQIFWNQNLYMYDSHFILVSVEFQNKQTSFYLIRYWLGDHLKLI